MVREVLEQSLATSSSQQDDGLRVKIGETLGNIQSLVSQVKIKEQVNYSPGQDWGNPGTEKHSKSLFFSAHVNVPKVCWKYIPTLIDCAVLFLQYGARSKVGAGEDKE